MLIICVENFESKNLSEFKLNNEERKFDDQEILIKTSLKTNSICFNKMINAIGFAKLLLITCYKTLYDAG